MLSHEYLLSFLDLLDLDEELIDSRLKTIIKAEKHSNKHLHNALKLLQYKQLINLQDNNDCDNNEECEFVAKLIKEINKENVDYVCDIISITLRLNNENIVAKAEHLVQQLIDFPITKSLDLLDEKSQINCLLSFKLIDSVLDAVIKSGKMIYLPFLEIPLDNILLSTDEKVKYHFLSSTIPKLFEAVVGNNILDIIWEYITKLGSDNVKINLTVLSFLSDYYLPIKDSKGIVLYRSCVCNQYHFWNNILTGMLSDDVMLRKLAVYLAKRAIDCVMDQKRDICVKSINNTIIFEWLISNSKSLQIMWNNFFILLDSLEEKQSNIVLPSLKLLDSLRNLGCWLNCAFNVGLKHDNTHVRFQCILHRLNTKLYCQAEAKLFLEALNDINIYYNNKDIDKLKTSLITYMMDENVLLNILMSMSEIKWSAVPLFHLSDVLAKGQFKCVSIGDQVTKAVIDILKISCNSTVLRKAIHINISQFIGNTSTKLHWKDCVNIYSNLKFNILENIHIDNPYILYITKKLTLNENEKDTFFQLLMESHLYIDFIFLYLLNHKDDMDVFIKLLDDKLMKLENIVSRQYSDKRESINDAIYLIQVYSKTATVECPFMETISSIISSKYKSILLYILSVVSSNLALPLESIILMCTGLNSISMKIKNNEVKDILIQIYKTCVILIEDQNTLLETCLMSLGIVEILLKDRIMLTNYSHEMLNLSNIIVIAMKFDNKHSDGRLKNIFYERATEIVYNLLKDNYDIERNLDVILEYVHIIIERGGYGCLKVCLNIINKILPQVIEKKSSQCNITDLITKLWKEIEELKSNKQYNPCIEEFIKIITHDSLIYTPVHNNTVTFYCKQIIDYGSVKTTPLYYLIKSINNKNLTAEHGHLIYVLCDILLYCPVLRKDQRIADNLIIEVLKEPKYDFKNNVNNQHFHYEIEFMSILALSKVKDVEVLTCIETLIESIIDNSFKNKQRYHGQSQAHRLLLKSIQHLLLAVLLIPSNHQSRMLWCINMLGKLPHQPSVRICLEWYIALQLYMKQTTLDEDIFKHLSEIPLTSQFVIVYWVIKRKIINGTCSTTEFEFVMNMLLSHTMGQMFNIRLHAQYLANELYTIKKCDSYSCIIKVIRKTFAESANDKNFMKFQRDYFVNDFDIVRDLTPGFLYYTLPRYSEINSNELVDVDRVRDMIKEITDNIKVNQAKDNFHEEWSLISKTNDQLLTLNVGRHEASLTTGDMETSGTIQKKYIPWKNMSDINMYETEKRQSKSELIVVASLIDKLPNLGGMARTSEVFGVKTYVVDSLRHLQDKQFQGLSVSAERWVDIEEVRPGAPLKQYLMAKKSEGYKVVAAEQTSTSCKLESFKFPLKTLLLLGHEKEGIPCDLLPIMDYCVEIPQQGLVRSLNVHVTAAIFIWEYSRQNILK
ncbi:hypothetical protein ACJJTC_003230 [Scirpophaga incertulas]